MSKTKRSGRGMSSLTPGDALGMLASAITYLQAVGLTVRAANDPQLGLVLAINGARLVQDAGVMRFVPISVASTPSTENTITDRQPRDEAAKVASMSTSCQPTEPS